MALRTARTTCRFPLSLALLAVASCCLPPLAFAQVLPTVTHPDQPTVQPPPTGQGRSQSPIQTQTPSSPSPSPSPAAPSTDRVNITAEHVYYREGATAAQGNAKLEYGDITVQADSLEVDADQIWARFRGHVKITSPNQETAGDELVVNLDTQQWEVRGGKSVVHPAYFKGGPKEDIFAKGKVVEGQGDGLRVQAFNAEATSCDKDDPHYELRSSQIDIRPRKKVIFHKPTLELLGHRVFRYPFNVTMSLEESRQKIIPEIGQNAQEGYFAKFGFLYMLSDTSSGVLRLNLTQLRGPAYGFDHLINTPRHNLQASVMFEPQESSLTSHISDRLQWSSIFSSQFNTTMQRNSAYGSASSTNTSSDLTFRRSDLQSATELGLQRSVTQGAFSTGSSNQTRISHEQRNGDSLNWRLQSVMRDTSFSSTTPPDKNLETNFDLTHRGGRFDTQVLVQNHSIISSSSPTSGFGSSVDRSPEFIFTTDSKRMHDWGPFGLLPVRSQFYLGSYKQAGSDTIRRMGFDADFGRSSYGFGSDTGLNLSGKLRQMFYSDGSAQYTAAINAEQRNKITKTWQTSLRFTESKPNGFSPLKTDYASRTSNLSFEAVQYIPNRRRIDLTSGYDFLGNRYQDISLRGEFMTGEASKLDVQGGYSLDQSQWRPLQLRWLKVVQDARYLSLSSQYDLAQHQLSTVDMELDYRVTPKWRLNVLSSYNGVTKTLAFADVRVTRDLHCMIATATYSMALREFRIDLGLKAFPSSPGPLGVGRLGSQFQSGAGQFAY